MSEPSSLETPVLMLVFNRPEPTRHVFEAIRTARPRRLYVAGDGARPGVTDDAARVQAVRDIVTREIDWDCRLRTLFRPGNLGCKYGVSGAISWFFEHEESGIILEDDCLPNSDFFRFCEFALEAYRDEPGIWQVGGNNFGYRPVDRGCDPTAKSHLLVRIPQIWGWATWRSRWAAYDVELSHLEHLLGEKADLANWLGLSGNEFWQMAKRFRHSADGTIDTWDYQWHATVLANRGLCIVPPVNLVSNIGDGQDATHVRPDDRRLKLPTGRLVWPLVRRAHLEVDLGLQEHMLRNMALRLSLPASLLLYLYRARRAVTGLIDGGGRSW